MLAFFWLANTDIKIIKQLIDAFTRSSVYGYTVYYVKAIDTWSAYSEKEKQHPAQISR